MLCPKHIFLYASSNLVDDVTDEAPPLLTAPLFPNKCIADALLFAAIDTDGERRPGGADRTVDVKPAASQSSKIKLPFSFGGEFIFMFFHS